MLFEPFGILDKQACSRGLSEEFFHMKIIFDDSPHKLHNKLVLVQFQNNQNSLLKQSGDCTDCIRKEQGTYSPVLWSIFSRLINGLIALCKLTSEPSAKYCKRGHVSLSSYPRHYHYHGGKVDSSVLSFKPEMLVSHLVSAIVLLSSSLSLYPEVYKW